MGQQPEPVAVPIDEVPVDPSNTATGDIESAAVSEEIRSITEAPFIETPRRARCHYAKRFGIESSYRLGEQTTASTTTQQAAPRFLFVVVSLLLQNVWRYLHWEDVSPPRRGGRQLWRRPFEEFAQLATRAAWRAPGKRQTVPTNRPPDDRFER